LALLAVGGATVAVASATTKPKSDSKSKTEPAIPSTKKPTPTTSGSTPSTATTKTATRQSKALKSVPGENRGKRTLYDFGNAGYLYPEVASRRAGYVDNYYPQTGYYNGQQAIGKTWTHLLYS